MDISNFNDLIDWTNSSQLPKIYTAVLFAQAIHETGRFTSNIFLNANNAFGMRPALKREQNIVSILDTANGQFAVYADTKSSFIDRVHLDEYNNTPKPRYLQDIEPYIDMVLGKNYVPVNQRSSYKTAWIALTNEVLMNNKSLLDMGNTTDSELGEILNSSNLDSDTPMTFAGINPKIIVFIIGAVLAFFGVKKIKKRFF